MTKYEDVYFPQNLPLISLATCNASLNHFDVSIPAPVTPAAALQEHYDLSDNSKQFKLANDNDFSNESNSDGITIKISQ